MSGFKGRYKSTLDAKARVAVPAKLRRASPDGTTDRFVITLGLDGCLFQVVGNLDVVTSDLQLAVMKTRMQPIKKVFGRFPRVVRDLARSLNKEIELIEKDVLFIGALRRIELWRPDAYEHYLQEFDSSYEDVAEELLL